MEEIYSKSVSSKECFQSSLKLAPLYNMIIKGSRGLETLKAMIIEKHGQLAKLFRSFPTISHQSGILFLKYNLARSDQRRTAYSSNHLCRIKRESWICLRISRKDTIIYWQLTKSNKIEKYTFLLPKRQWKINGQKLASHLACWKLEMPIFRKFPRWRSLKHSNSIRL